MENLVLNSVEVKIDEHGRYSLTDLWKASGLGDEKKPAQFLKSDGVKRLIEKLKVTNSTFEPMVKTRGRYDGGTWAVKHLVYKYAMWVDVDFEIKVIDVFDSAVNGRGDSAVAIAKGNVQLRDLIDKRDGLILIASTQQERDEVERLTSLIHKEVSPAARVLSMVRGKGKGYVECELNRINSLVQLDIFNGDLSDEQ